MSAVKKTGNGTGTDGKVPVRLSENQYNRYNMTLPQSFSVYNDEGSVIYRGEVEQMANRLRAELFGIEPTEAPSYDFPETAEKPQKVQKPSRINAYTKKRTLFLVIPIILVVAILFFAVCGLFAVPFKSVISIYNYNYVVETNFPMTDPFISFLSEKFGIETGSIPAEFGKCFELFGEDFLSSFAGYIVPVAIALYIVFALIMLIAAIAGVAGKKREDGTYAKARLGFLSIIMFLCSLIVLVGGLAISGTQASEIGGFFTGSGDFTAGYGLYLMIIVPVITFICTCVAYGKDKTAEKGKGEE